MVQEGDLRYQPLTFSLIDQLIDHNTIKLLYLRLRGSDL